MDRFTSSQNKNESRLILLLSFNTYYQRKKILRYLSVCLKTKTTTGKQKCGSAQRSASNHTPLNTPLGRPVLAMLALGSLDPIEISTVMQTAKEYNRHDRFNSISNCNARSFFLMTDLMTDVRLRFSGPRVMSVMMMINGC